MNSVGRPKHLVCKRGHSRTPENLYKGRACKICVKQYRNTDEYKVNARRRYSLNPQYFRSASAEWKTANHEKMRCRDRVADWKFAGIKDMTLDKYNRFFEKQNGKCAICGIARSELTRNFDVDHNKQTGEPRGLLCRKCNWVRVGAVERELKFLPRILEYLNEGNHASTF
jgi:hypothetical protein